MTFAERWLKPESRSRRLLLALGIYLMCATAYAAVAGAGRLGEHTQYNHYAHLADAWLHGRQDLAHGPPNYALGNDFAQVDGKTYISFPPFPAVLMLPFVALAGSPENFRDGQFVIWLAGVGPAVVFLVLEKLRRDHESGRTERENAALSLLFAFGTVYFFTAVEGTVWFAAHVVGVALLALYALFSLGADQPVLAGGMLGCAFLTRPTMTFAISFFALEALRVSCKKGGVPADGVWRERVRGVWERLDKRALTLRYVEFAVPVAAAVGVMSLMNHTRFHTWDPSSGHEYLTVAWHGRIQKWGLVGYHYLSKNLGCMLTGLPWPQPRGTSVVWWSADGHGTAPFLVNEHGLALWFTTPIYFWLLWPKRAGWLHTVTWIAAAGPLVMDLLYQNSGWRQFGYRFSNDYSVFLFMLLALGGRPLGRLFRTAAAWGVAWNLFGAITFDRLTPPYDRYYFRDGSQNIVYQPD